MLKACTVLVSALALAHAQLNQGFQSQHPSRQQQQSQIQPRNQFQQQPSQYQQQSNQYQQQSNQYQEQPSQFQKQSTSSGSCGDKKERTPVPGSCDRYIECFNGTAEEKTCPDGLRFNPELRYGAYPCQYPIDMPCLERAALQPAQPTDDCPHQFGYYRLGDASNCGGFRNCANGRGYDLLCPDGLAFNTQTYQCDWPDLVPDCDAEAFVGFRCPEIPITKELGEPAGYRFYKSDSDCQKYFVCVNGRPRRMSCGVESGYDELRSACAPADEVAACPAELRAQAAASRDEEQQRLARANSFKTPSA